MKKVSIHYRITGDEWIELELEDEEDPLGAIQEEAPTPLDFDYEVLEVLSEDEWKKQTKD